MARHFIVYVCGCATDFTLLIISSPLPFMQLPLSLSLSLCLSLFVSVYVFYTDWCIFRLVLTRLEPCGFGFGIQGSGFRLGCSASCGFLPLAHAKQKGLQIEFCGRCCGLACATSTPPPPLAPLPPAQPIKKGVNKCAGNSSVS